MGAGLSSVVASYGYAQRSMKPDFERVLPWIIRLEEPADLIVGEHPNVVQRCVIRAHRCPLSQTERI